MRKRLLSTMLCLCMVMTIIPSFSVTALAAEAPAETISNSEMLDPNMDPGEEWENDQTNPYGTNKDQPFSLNPINELVFYTNQKTPKETGRESGGRIYTQDYVVDKSHANSVNGNYYVKDTIAYGTVEYLQDMPNMGYVCGVAFDPYGTGRADHAAYVGLYTVEGTTYSGYWIQNLKTAETTPVTKLEVVPDWGSDYMLHYQARNFLNITAGDYNGNGKETVMLTVPGYNNIIAMNTPATPDYSKACTIFETSCINSKKYAIDWGDAGNNMKAELSVSLATGDFDRDGIDELAVSAGKCYVNDSTYETTLGNMNNYTTWLTIFNRNSQGVFDALGAVNRQCLLTHDKSKDNTASSTIGGTYLELNEHYYNNIRFASISAGDVNGDGYDDVVVAGYLGDITRRFSTISGDDYDYCKVIGKTENKIAYATYYGGSNTVTEVKTMDMNKYTTKGTPTKMEIRPALAVSCASLDGYGTSDYVFIAGNVYTWKGDGTASKVFQTERADTEGVRNAQLWYDSATVGNFDGNAAGREQIVAVAYEKSANHQYYDCYIDTIGGYEYNDVKEKEKVVSYGSIKSLYSTSSSTGKVIDQAYSDTDKNRMSCLVLAADVDDDGVLVKYETKYYGYSDAQVQAVLQAAPYFGELGDYDEDFSDGATSYSISSGYTDTTTSSNSVSFGAAFVTEHSFGVYKFDVNAGITVDWTETYEQSLSVEYSSEFSAGGDDTVVLYRIPATTYYYSVYNPDTKQFEYDENNAMAVVIPETPVYTTMDKASYNKFAVQYNERYKDSIENSLAKALPLITEEVLPNAIGDPFKYWRDYGKVTVPGANTQGTVSGFVSLSDSPKQLGTGSSSITNGWTKSEEFSNGTETAMGFAVSTSHQWGSDNHSFGFELSFGYNHAWGKVYTTMDSMGASGTVNSLDRGAMERNYGIPANITDQYNFTWEFGMRTWELGEDNSVPIFGYVLTSLRAGSPRPSDLEAEITSLDSIKLDWTNPETDITRPYDGLNIWLSKDGDSYEKINDEPLAADKTSYSVSGLDSNTSYSFVVTSTCNGSDGAFSPAATVTMPKKNYTVTYTGSNADISASYLGNISIDSGAPVTEDSIVFVTAAPKTGYTITGITLTTSAGTEDVTLVGGKFNFILRDDTSIQVNTSRIVESSELTFKQPAKGGSFTASVDGVEVSGDYVIVVDPVELTAAPADGYVMKAWLVDENQIQALGNNTMTFTPYEGAHTISALFAEEDNPEVNVTLTVNDCNGGSLEITDESGEVITPEDGSLSLLMGTRITITAKPEKHYSLSNWADALSNYGKDTHSVTFSVTEDMTIGAEFYAPIKYPVSFSADINGTLTAEMDGVKLTEAKVNVVPGSSIEFTAAADQGYRISSWTITGFDAQTVSCGDRLVTEDSLSLTNITSSATVLVNFTPIKAYTLTFVPGTGTGTQYTNQTNELTKYTLPANTFIEPESMVFNGWQIGNKVYGAGDILVFSEDTTITALWKSQSSGGSSGSGGTGGTGGTGGVVNTSSVTVEQPKNGTITVSHRDASEGTTVTITVKPDQGYKLDTLSVTDKNGDIKLTGKDGKYTFTMPDSEVTVKGIFAEIGKPIPVVNPFIDIKESNYYYDEVLWAVENGITDGTSDTTFSPNLPTTRAQMVTFLWRAAGYPKATISDTVFTDVDKNAYYYDALLWAIETGITKGTSATTFTPNASCSRGQMAAFLYRYDGSKAVSGEHNFTDVTASDYYNDAVTWAVKEGITYGTSDTTYSPNTDCTRAQMVVFLYRLLVK